MTTVGYSAIALANVALSGNVVVLLNIAGVLLLVSFAIWLYRARHNLDAFPEAVARSRPAWALWAWFLPIIDLALIPWVVADLARHALPRRAAVLLTGAWLVALEASSTLSRGLPKAYWSTIGLAWEPDRTATWWAPCTTVAILIFAACQISAVALITRAQARRVTSRQVAAQAASVRNRPGAEPPPRQRSGCSAQRRSRTD
ncbi:DUF4328 domain-containing protein [Luedemannella helvata]|uniref:DUF4328 domain-containing protein n=1 Tax=Luedemannella helvata TaxID=349315 RepID=A0ABP4W7G1_9ACTN